MTERDGNRIRVGRKIEWDRERKTGREIDSYSSRGAIKVQFPGHIPLPPFTQLL